MNSNHPEHRSTVDESSAGIFFERTRAYLSESEYQVNENILKSAIENPEHDQEPNPRPDACCCDKQYSREVLFKDPDGSEERMNEEYKTLNRIQVTNFDKYQDSCTTLFNVVLGQIDPNMKELLSLYPLYQRISDDEDFIELLKLIKNACNSNNGGTRTFGLMNGWRVSTLHVCANNPRTRIDQWQSESLSKRRPTNMSLS